MSDDLSDLPRQISHVSINNDGGLTAGDIPGIGDAIDPVALGPKQDDPVALGPKQDDPVALGPKQDDPVALGPKQDDPVALGPKQDDPVALGPKQDDPVALGPKQDDPVALGPKQDDPVALGPKQDDPVALGPKQDDPVALGPKQDDPTQYGDPSAPDTTNGGAIPVGSHAGDLGVQFPGRATNPFTNVPRDSAPRVEGPALVNPIGPGVGDGVSTSAPSQQNGPFAGTPGFVNPASDPRQGRTGLLRNLLIGLLVLALLAGGGVAGVAAYSSSQQCGSAQGIPGIPPRADCGQKKPLVPTAPSDSASQGTDTAIAISTDTPAPAPAATTAPTPQPVLSVSANTAVAYCYNPDYSQVTITIQNTGAGTLHWTAATEDPANVIPSPTSGSVSAGMSQDVGLVIPSGGGTHSTPTLTVSVTSDGGNKDLVFTCELHLH